jgi:delta24-sterol reductase
MLVPVYKVGEALEFNEREFEVYPIWLCPHRLYKVPQKGVMITPEPGYEKHKRPGDTPAAQMYTDVGLYYAPGNVYRPQIDLLWFLYLARVWLQEA